ncbi:hypothetical protein K1W54_06745 [Micromonospora sp. CPCC 205371]|nr:hypothetical protein [Micromonospora sp. CPCC 205371]
MSPDRDVGSRLDLSRPPRVEIAAPLTPAGAEAYSEITSDLPAADVIAELNRMLIDGRARAMGASANDASPRPKRQAVIENAGSAGDAEDTTPALAHP